VDEPRDEDVIAATKAWLDKDVIGLNLCPFAKAVHVAGQIRYVVSSNVTEAGLAKMLGEELILLHEADPEKIDTTLIVHPRVLLDFYDQNNFLEEAEGLLSQLGLVGKIQIASFHPHYQFEGTEPDDVTNRTNRSPYPTLHLLREASVERAVENYPDAEGIPTRNIETMRRLEREDPGRLPPTSSPAT
jgi:hypothetical protein